MRVRAGWPTVARVPAACVWMLTASAVVGACSRPNQAHEPSRPSGPEAGPSDAQADAIPVPPDAPDVDADVAAMADAGIDARPVDAAMTAGLILHWTFDETAGSQVRDSSLTGFHGTALGASGGPTPSTAVPMLQFPDPRSRTFVLARQDAVRALALPAALRLTNNLTLSVWYRATTADSSSMANGSEIVSLGDNLVLRVHPAQFEFGKQGGPAGSEFLKCFAHMDTHLDGKWHHVAAVAASGGMRIYFDGIRVCSNGTGDDIRYVEGNDLWVGRHATSDRNHFDGNIDDLRIYGRALSASEIAILAAGGQ